VTTPHLLETQDEIRRLLPGIRRVAVLGIKPESAPPKPAYYVPKALIDMGLDVIPVPVYEFGVTEILGRPIVKRLADIPGRIDLVDVFRRPADLAQHLPDLLAAKPGAVWLQLGIRNDPFAEQLAAAGIDVVQDHCLMVEYRRWRALSGLPAGD
jgi:predicted CoA-binding protein